MEHHRNILHIISVSFSINYFFGDQFRYLKKKTGNTYFLGCSPSKELDYLSESLQFEKLEVEITRSISPIKDLKAIFQIYKFIKKNNIETVVGHTPKGGMVAMIAAFLAGVSHRIYFRHGIVYETSKGLKRFLLLDIDRLSGNLANQVVCVSNAVRKISVQDALNSPKKNIILGLGTCSGVDTDGKYNPLLVSNVHSENLKKELNIKKDDIVIGFVGRIVRDKGLNDLVQAWQILQAKYDNIKLLLVGPIEERDSISDEAKSEIESNRTIIHTGFVLHSSPYFSLMDVFVLPTYREGFPTVTLEASSMGIPVVTTYATGCEESIIENQTGVFTKNDYRDMASKISNYIDNEALRRAHGRQGREFVRANFEQQKIWDIISEKLNY